MCGFHFNLCYPTVPVTYSDGLENTPGTANGNGHTSGQAVNIKNNFHPN